MAMTFRDFLRGIAESAPVMADLVYKQTLYNNEMAFKEQEMELEERRVAAYEGTQNMQQELLGMQQREIETLLPITTETERINQDIAKMNQTMAKGKMDAITQIPDYHLTTIKNDLEVQKQNILAAKNTALSANAQRILAETEAKLAQSNAAFNTFVTVTDMVSNPEKAQSLIDQSSPNGVIDWNLFAENAANENVMITTPTRQKAKMDFGLSMLNTVHAYDNAAMGQASNLMRDIMNPDKKYDKTRYAYTGETNIKKIDPNEAFNTIYGGFQNRPDVMKMRPIANRYLKEMELGTIPEPLDIGDGYGTSGDF